MAVSPRRTTSVRRLQTRGPDADWFGVENCPTCGSPRSADGWCPRCLHPTSATAPIVGASASRSSAAHPPTVEVIVGSRFGADSVHFGLAGRVIWTAVLIAIPIVTYEWGGFPYGLAFAGLWSIMLLPRALRQLWSSGQRRVRVDRLP